MSSVSVQGSVRPVLLAKSAVNIQKVAKDKKPFLHSAVQKNKIESEVFPSNEGVKTLKNMPFGAVNLQSIPTFSMFLSRTVGFEPSSLNPKLQQSHDKIKQQIINRKPLSVEKAKLDNILQVNSNLCQQFDTVLYDSRTSPRLRDAYRNLRGVHYAASRKHVDKDGNLNPVSTAISTEINHFMPLLRQYEQNFVHNNDVSPTYNSRSLAGQISQYAESLRTLFNYHKATAKQ